MIRPCVRLCPRGGYSNLARPPGGPGGRHEQRSLGGHVLDSRRVRSACTPVPGPAHCGERNKLQALVAGRDPRISTQDSVHRSQVLSQDKGCQAPWQKCPRTSAGHWLPWESSGSQGGAKAALEGAPPPTGWGQAPRWDKMAVAWPPGGWESSRPSPAEGLPGKACRWGVRRHPPCLPAVALLGP